MKHRSIARVLFAWVVGFALTSIACGGTPTVDAGDATDNDVAIDAPPPADVTDADAAVADTGPSGALVRFAHFVTNIPAYDICYKPNDVSRQFMGPVFRAAGLAGGLRYGNVSEYISVEPRMYAWRIVAPDATDCSTPLMDSPPMLYFNTGNVGSRTTVTTTGVLNGTPPNQLRSFNVEDPPLNGPAGMIQLVMFSAALGAGQLEIGAVSGTMFTPIVTGVDYGTTRTGTGMPLAAGSLGIRRVGMTMLDLQAMNVSIPAMKTRTVFAYGTIGDPARPVSMLLCDNSMAAGHLSVCDAFPMR